MRIFAMALIVLVIIAGSSAAETQDFDFGVGIIVGEPTGIDFKKHLTRANAIEAAAAWSLSGDNHFHIQADYLRHNYDIINVSKGELPIFFGLGGRIVFRENRLDVVDQSVGV